MWATFSHCKETFGKKKKKKNYKFSVEIDIIAGFERLKNLAKRFKKSGFF